MSNSFFDIQQFMPHGHCFHWQPGILWTHVVADILIGFSYYSIPLALFYYLSKSSYKGRFISKIVYLFMAFILFCGTTHFLAIWTMWTPVYYFEGIIKVATAIISIFTAICLWPLVPKALTIPTPEQLRNTQEELEKVNSSLEFKIKSATQESEERAKKLQETNQRLESFSKHTVGREIKMVELKKEVNALCEKYGEQPRYEIVDRIQT